MHRVNRHCRAAPDTPWAEGRTCAAVGSCLSNFRHPPFAAMWVFCLCYGLPQMAVLYFMQYFLQDVVVGGLCACPRSVRCTRQL
jgi:hypothetical protein